MNKIKQGFNLVFNPKGTVSRKQFLLGTFLSALIGIPFFFFSLILVIGLALRGSVWYMWIFLWILLGLGVLSMSPILIKRLRTVTGSGYWYILIPVAYYFLWTLGVVRYGPSDGILWFELMDRLTQLPGNIFGIAVPMPIFFILHTILLSIAGTNSTVEKTERVSKQ